MFQQVDGKEVSYVLESKKMCRDLGMNPDKTNKPKNIISELELTKKKETYKEILEVANFVGEKMLRSLEGSPILIAISDEKGFLLDILGDETIKSTMYQNGIKAGVQLIEEEVGTNIVSLTLKQKKPAQLIGKDHYHTAFHDWACYGVPFYYSDDNSLLGGIYIVTEAIRDNPFFLRALTAAGETIERELLLRRQSRKINKQQELLYKSEKRQRELLEKDLIMKDEFITLITHEFKTPINVIYSAIQLIEHLYINKIPKKVISLIESIKRNTFRQLHLVNNIIDITKLSSNQVELNISRVDIISLTKLIIELVDPYAKKRKLNLYFESDISSKNIGIDDEKYERIILNLLSNAIKFTPEGGSITVKIKEDKKENTVVIYVSDTGIGIPEEKYETIFRKFGQVENKLSRQAEGSGIGLALAAMLVNILDGKIEVDSKVGVGSTFTITLPIKEVEAYEENQGYLDVKSRLINAINIEFSDIYF